MPAKPVTDGLVILLLVAVLAGCSATPFRSGPKALSGGPPHLWSGQKVLAVSPQVCAASGERILRALSFAGVVRNGSYVYGTLMANRAAIKCIAIGDGRTFVYAAVAGPDRAQVERLRNEIVWRL